MIELKVGSSDSCHYKTIGEAIESIPYDSPAHIYIEAGIYKEKLFCDKADLTISGAGMSKTIITYSDGGKFIHYDGDMIGTFRSYTAFFGGKNIKVENCSIFNEAGNGKIAGQSLAVYADGENILFQNVHLASCQDTLFCAPLPLKERIPGGFKGPRKFLPRKLSRQVYKSCRIEGDIDFIFGGADAFFYDCDIISVDKGTSEESYVTAPSGNPENLGFVFYHCRFLSDCPESSVYLGRPWRAYGKTTLIECFIDRHIKPEGWDYWGNPENQNTCTFSEYLSTFPSGYKPDRVSWAKDLLPEDAAAILSNYTEFLSK